MKIAEKTNTVRVHYRGTFPDGEEFDSSQGREPLEFTVGAGQMIAGFDQAVEGMKVNEKKTIRLQPDQAYGAVDERLINKVPRTQFPQGVDPQIGQTLVATSPNGHQMRVVVKTVEQDTVTLDGNHPMAGKELIFDIELVEVLD